MGYASYLEDIVRRLEISWHDAMVSDRLTNALGQVCPDASHFLNQAVALAGQLAREKDEALNNAMRSLLEDIDQIITGDIQHPNDVIRAEQALLQRGSREAAAEIHARIYAFVRASRRDALAAVDPSVKELFSTWRRVERDWGAFCDRRDACWSRYRPRLGEVGLLSLNDEQRQLVGVDQGGHRRINAQAGTGKTVVLIHRALLLAQSARSVLLLTPTESLAAEVRAAVDTLRPQGATGPSVRSLPEVLARWLETERKAGRIASSAELDAEWNAFVDEADRDRRHVLREPASREFMQRLKAALLNVNHSRLVPPERYEDNRRTFRVNNWRALEYVRDEVHYFASGFESRSDSPYLAGVPRGGRELRFEALDRTVFFRIFGAWSRWLEAKELYDPTLLASELLGSIALGTAALHESHDHVLVDEAQDFGTCEWGLILRMVTDLGATNALLAAGDPEQRARVSRYAPNEIIKPDGTRGFSFRGRSTSLSRQYRVTKQIADAATRLITAFPRKSEADDDERGQTTHSLATRTQYEGWAPILVQEEQPLHRLAHLLKSIDDSRTVGLLAARDTKGDIRFCEDIARTAGLTAQRFQRSGASKRERIVYGTVDSVGGCEFDVVFVVNFSAMPSSHIPEEEWWREAAKAYNALTRARELVVLSCPPGSHSPFLEELLREPAVVHSELPDSLGGYLRALVPGEAVRGSPSRSGDT